MTIKNTQHSPFLSDEHYNAFITAWANANKSLRSKTTYTNQPVTVSYSTKIIKQKIDGWITAKHHILYNLLTGKKIYNGFTPITNSIKLVNGMYINHGLYWGYCSLLDLKDSANQLIISNNKKIINSLTNITWKPGVKLNIEQQSDTSDFYNEYLIKKVMAFLEPFDGTVSVEMLSNIDIPKISPLYSNFGTGQKIARQIISNNTTNKIELNTMNDLYQLIDSYENTALKECI